MLEHKFYLWIWNVNTLFLFLKEKTIIEKMKEYKALPHTKKKPQKLGIRTDNVHAANKSYIRLMNTYHGIIIYAYLLNWITQNRLTNNSNKNLKCKQPKIFSHSMINLVKTKHGYIRLMNTYVLHRSMKLTKTVFFVPSRRTWGGLITVLRLSPASSGLFSLRMLNTRPRSCTAKQR